MSKKQVPLPRRPEPPSAQQIIQDIEDSSANDIVFSSMIDDVKRQGSPDPMTESFASVDEALSSPQLQTVNNGTDITDDTKDVEETYRQAVKFISLMGDLELAPEKLQERYNGLQTLGSELEKSIGNLKRQSETALGKSRSHTGKVKK